MADRTMSVLGGLVISVVLFISIREFTADWWAASTFRSRDRGYALGLLLVGLIVGVTALASRARPLLTAVPAVLYLPLLANFSVPSWYPGWLSRGIGVGFSPAVHVIVGALGVAAIAGFIADLDHQEQAMPEGVPPGGSG